MEIGAEDSAGVSAGGGRLLPTRGSGGITPGKFWDFICKVLQSSEFWWENGPFRSFLCVLKHFYNGNGVPTRSPSKWPLGCSATLRTLSQCPRTLGNPWLRLCHRRSVMACSHRRHGQDKTILSCPRRRCEQAITQSASYINQQLVRRHRS